ncbi:hypothetical protein [Streptomyces eurythermus]|uniref:hypothetical protein n=1 Tax=Streptomyces eurythermus TaxID=42237 RepID=UPI0036D24EEF
MPAVAPRTATASRGRSRGQVTVVARGYRDIAVCESAVEVSHASVQAGRHPQRIRLGHTRAD